MLLYIGTKYVDKMKNFNFTRGYNSNEMGLEYFGSDKLNAKEAND